MLSHDPDRTQRTLTSGALSTRELPRYVGPSWAQRAVADNNFRRSRMDSE